MINKKENIGILLLGDQGDQAVKLQLVRAQLISNARLGMHGSGRDGLEARFDKILDDHWLRGGRARSAYQSKGLLSRLRRGGQRILEPKIQAVDTDRCRAQLQDFAPIDRVLACPAHVRNRELFVRVMPIKKPTRFRDKEDHGASAQDDRGSRFRRGVYCARHSVFCVASLVTPRPK